MTTSAQWHFNEKAHDYAFSLYRDHDGDINSIPEPIRTYLLIRIFKDQVDNGDFSQFFISTYADNARAVLDALKIIGARKNALVYEQMLRCFGPEGPAPDYDTRYNQMQQVGESEEFNTLTRSYWRRRRQYPEEIELHLAQYVDEHITDFGVAEKH